MPARTLNQYMKKILFLINRFSGKKNALSMAQEAKAFLEAEGYHIEWLESEYIGHFSAVASGLKAEETNIIAVFGGDGTMHEVVNGLMKLPDPSAIDIALFPAGSGNAFNYDLDCLNPEETLQRILLRNTRKVDVFEVADDREKRYSFNIVGWGLVTEINRAAERMRWIGNSRYTLSALLRIMRNPSSTLRITIDGRTHEGLFSFVLLCNTKHTGKGMKMAPMAELSDGWMDVLVVRKTSLFSILKLFPKIYSGKHIYSDKLEYVKAKRVDLHTSQINPLNIDGEIVGNSPCSIRMIPGAISVITSSTAR